MGKETTKMGAAKEISQEALEARRAYQREYRRRNRKRILERQRQWREENPDRVREHQRRHWEKKAQELKNG